MAKKTSFRISIVLGILLISTAGAWLYFTPKKVARHPDFSSMPVDTAGRNLTGSLPENLEAGGFMAGQNGLIYFANFADGGALYICRENGEDMIKVTDFPVCNINVMGSSVVFTGLERYSIEDAVIPAAGNFLSSSVISGDFPVSAGGGLYAVYGIDSGGKPELCAIEPGVVYYSPHLDRDGLYVTCGKNENEPPSILANKFYDTKVAVTGGEGYITGKFSYGDVIYAETFSSLHGSRVMRINAKTLFPADYLNGGSLHRIDGSFVFRGEDGYIYEANPKSGEIKPISATAVYNVLKANQFGEIIAHSAFQEHFGSDISVVISKKQRYNGIAQAVLSRRESKSIMLQNGWYNYFADKPVHEGPVKYFKANDKYYTLGEDGWSASWLNARLDTEPLVSLESAVVEDLFTPPWHEGGERGEPIDPASTEDFGSERRANPDDNRADAANDAQNALDAAILIFRDDDSIADKYTGKSVEKLRNRYGGALEAAVTDISDELSDEISKRLSADISPQELRDIVGIWLDAAGYSVKNARVSSDGEEASVTIATVNTVDLRLLYPALQSELSARAEAESGFARMADDERAAWRVDIISEIMREPDRYGFINNQPADSQIYMTFPGCWIVNSPPLLVRALIRGMN